MRLPTLRLATAFISSKSATVPAHSSSRSLQFSTTAFNMKSNAAAQAEGTVIVGGGIAGLAMANALRNVAGGECWNFINFVHKMCSFHYPSQYSHSIHNIIYTSTSSSTRQSPMSKCWKQAAKQTSQTPMPAPPLSSDRMVYEHSILSCLPPTTITMKTI